MEKSCENISSIKIHKLYEQVENNNFYSLIKLSHTQQKSRLKLKAKEIASLKMSTKYRHFDTMTGSEEGIKTVAKLSLLDEIKQININIISALPRGRFFSLSPILTTTTTIKTKNKSRLKRVEIF